ncbi:hypothetical protein LAZ67_21002131 [Cordylochernes scorpioides]|uniref:HTH CENPB-type domain-containing protein n=1 Tax=Cordylochernes scorpioides TaxID=51811 RepID=A0ABY6LMZ6_9ARAC|nr:hypothetical protein LAZ67_21002131 [Cordylochernes scorpioides]
MKKKSDIAKDFGIPRNTLSTYLKNKEKILRSESECVKGRKRLREPGNPDLDKCVLKWFKQARDKKIPVSGHLIRSKAEQFATEMGKPDFKASSGWLDGFKERNKISFKIICGESGAANLQVAEQWKNNLRELIQDKDARDVFNVDETGLFFKCTPDKTLAFKHEKCHGGKLSKERVTLLVGANMDGSEKLPLLMIGKAANPRCFKNVKTKPVDYANSARAWITSYLFEKWLLNLDKKFTKEKRKVILFIDNSGLVKKEEDEENADVIIAETMPSVDGWEDVISNPTISYDDFLNVDDDVAVCGEITDADIIAEVLNHNIEKQDGDEASGDEDESSVAGEMNIPSAAEATNYIMQLRRFFENALSQSRTFDWFGRFKAGRTSVKDDLHTGRPLSIRNPENALKFKSSIKENPRITIRELSEDLDISFGTCQTIIKNDLHLERSPAEFVPYLLTNEQKKHRKETYKKWSKCLILIPIGSKMLSQEIKHGCTNMIPRLRGNQASG